LSGYHLFYFQAEDGIRDFHVTGVQTCALPIFDSSKDFRNAFGLHALRPLATLPDKSEPYPPAGLSFLPVQFPTHSVQNHTRKYFSLVILPISTQSVP